MAGIEREGPLDGRPGLVDAPDREEKACAIHRNARVTHRIGHTRETREGRLEVAGPRRRQRAPDVRGPCLTGAVWEILGAEVENGRVVERPRNGVAGPHDDRAQHGRLPRARARRLPGGQDQRALRVLGEDLTLPHGQACLDRIDLDEELGPLDRAVDERGRDPEGPRHPAAEVHHARQELDPRRRAFHRRGEGDRGVLVKAHDRTVAEDEGSAGEWPEPHGVPGAVRGLQLDGQPLGLAGATGLDRPLHGDGPSDPVGAVGTLGGEGGRRKTSATTPRAEARRRSGGSPACASHQRLKRHGPPSSPLCAYRRSRQNHAQRPRLPAEAAPKAAQDRTRPGILGGSRGCPGHELEAPGPHHSGAEPSRPARFRLNETDFGNPVFYPERLILSAVTVTLAF